MVRSTRSKAAEHRNATTNDDAAADEENQPQSANNPAADAASAAAPAAVLPAAMRERNRAVAEREASRLARPERRVVGTLGHASKAKSAVTSTPSGVHAGVTSQSATMTTTTTTTTTSDRYFDDGDTPRSMTGGKTSKDTPEEWCGPFSVARQMIAKREEARRKREEEQAQQQQDEQGNYISGTSHPLDAMMEEVEFELKRKAHPSLQWKGVIAPDREKGNIYSKRQKRVQAQGRSSVPTLFSKCVDFLVDNFEHVDALGDIDSTIRRDICKGLVAQNKLNELAFNVIAEPGIEALEIIDCAEITQEQMSAALEKLLPLGLRFLLLHHSGRSFGPVAVKTIVSVPKSELFAISIAGAYLLSDTDAHLLLNATAKYLSCIEFKACPNLGPAFCGALNTNFASGIGHGTLLELSLEHLALTKQDLLSLSDTDAVRNLKSLSLRQMDTVDDEVVTFVLAKVGDDLENIDLSHCHQLTDQSLSAIRSCNMSGTLRSLQLSGLKHLTAVGVEALFTPMIPGLPSSPPMLRKLNISSCHYEAVTDRVLDLICRASSMKRDQDGDISQHYLSSSGGLVHVNVNGSSCTDTSMEYLAATSAMSLKELNVSFCPKVSDRGLGYLVSKAGSQLNKIHIWGCAQIGDAFLDGHARVHDPGLHIIGAWIKKGNTVSAR